MSLAIFMVPFAKDKFNKISPKTTVVFYEYNIGGSFVITGLEDSHTAKLSENNAENRTAVIALLYSQSIEITVDKIYQMCKVREDKNEDKGNDGDTLPKKKPRLLKVILATSNDQSDSIKT